MNFFFSIEQLIAIFFVITIVNAQIRPILQARDRDAVILKQVYEPNPDGSYVYRWKFKIKENKVFVIIMKEIDSSSYETSNGIAADQQGFVKNRGTNLEAQVT